MSNSKPKQLFDLDLLSIPELPDNTDNLIASSEVPEPFGSKYIVFSINEKNHAIPSDSIAEVVRPLSHTRLPNIPNWLVGIANLRGDIISIIDLHFVLNTQTIDSPKSKLIVLRSTNSVSHIAFQVDKVREIVTFPDNKVKLNDDGKSAFSRGVIDHQAIEINLLDVDEIVASLNLQ